MELKIRISGTQTGVYTHDLSKTIQGDKEHFIGEEIELITLEPIIMSKEEKEKLFKNHEITLMSKK